MKKTTIYIYVSIFFVLLSALLIGVFFLKTRDGIKVYTHTFREYTFKDKQTEKEFKDWIKTIPLKEIPFEDFDLCYIPWNDTIWDRTNRNIIDTFNLRLHTHRTLTNIYRTDTYYKNIKGVCRINLQWIYLYDTLTINHYFIPTDKKRTIISYTGDHILSWYDGESVYVAQATDHIRPIDTQYCNFCKGYEFFFETNDFSNFTKPYEVINKDSFCVRPCGPYLVLSEKDTLSREETKDNFCSWCMDNLPESLLDSITPESRISVAYYVDANGKYTIQNFSTGDLKDKISTLCMELPDFIPAMERGITVNSIIPLRCYPYYETKKH